MNNAEQAMENYNIARDPRSGAPANIPTLSLWACTECGAADEKCDCDAEMADVEEQLPWKFEVCPVCSGNGKHVNPAIDAGGLSHEMQDDPDFHDQYMSGVYDVPCRVCEGKRVVPVVDWDALEPDRKAAYEAQLQADADNEAERMAEIRMGC